MNTLTIVVKATGATAEWLIVGELPTMNTIRPIPCEGGYEVAVDGHELQSGGILHHMRQQGHFCSPDITF